MPEFEYKSENLTSDSVLNYKLSIQLNLDGFSFWLKDTGSDEIMLFRHYRFRLSMIEGLTKKISHLKERDELLQNRYPHTEITLSLPLFSLLPPDCIHGRAPLDIHDFNYGIKKHSPVKRVKTPLNGPVLVFSYPQFLDEFFKETFGEYLPIHIVSSSLRYSEFLAGNTRDFLFSYFIPEGFFLVIFREGSLFFVNYFSCSGDDDIQFFLASAFHQLGKMNKGIPLFIGGNYDGKKMNAIRSVSDVAVYPISAIPEGVSGKPFLEIPFHRFFNLIY